jgi:secondary thiamine-phosphate synthase enzyme
MASISATSRTPYPNVPMKSETFELRTDGRLVHDLTERISSFVRDEGDGLVHVFAPHATAGLALMETGAGSEGDLEELLARTFPRDDRYAHRHGSVGHGGDHLLPAFVSPSLTLPVLEGEIALGTWQSIVLVDPNRENDVRTVRVSFVPA